MTYHVLVLFIVMYILYVVNLYNTCMYTNMTYHVLVLFIEMYNDDELLMLK